MTAPRDVRAFLDDILEYSGRAARFAEGVGSAAQLAADEMRYLAVIRALEVVGEAAKNVPPAIRALAPDVPWSAMTGMRDRLIHGYPVLDAALLWQTAAVDAPAVEPAIRALIARLDAEPRAGGGPAGDPET